MSSADPTGLQMLPLIVSLFIPCIIILLLSIYATCKRRPLELLRTQRYSKKQTCYFAIHVAVALFYLSSLSLNVVNVYSDTALPSEITFNLSSDYISWSFLIISALSLQMASTMRYDRYYIPNTALNVALAIFYITLMTLYVCRRVDFPNPTSKYIVVALCVFIVLLFAYLAYKLYLKPIRKLGLLLDHYIDDIVTDKRKEDQYTDSLKNNQIELLVAGWIREHKFSVFIPIDIEQLCGMYIFHTFRKETSGSRGSLLSGLFSLSMSTVSAKQTFHGHTVNRFTKDKLETAIKKMFMYKLVGIAMFACVLIYCLRFILIWDEIVYFSNGTKNEYKLFMDIVLYVFVWIEAFCNCLLMPSNKFIYNRCCCVCTYWINTQIMKQVDIKYNERKLRGSLSPFAAELRWSFATESKSRDSADNSWKNTNYTYYNRQSLDSFIYTSRSRLLT